MSAMDRLEEYLELICGSVDTYLTIYRLLHSICEYNCKWYFKADQIVVCIHSATGHYHLILGPRL